MHPEHWGKTRGELEAIKARRKASGEDVTRLNKTIMQMMSNGEILGTIGARLGRKPVTNLLNELQGRDRASRH